jgi:hypothetical protein
MNKERFVLSLDLLGYSQLVLNNTPQELKKIYNNEVSQTISAIEKYSESIFDHDIKFDAISANGETFSENRQNQINFHIMSDSVIAWTDDDNIKSLKNLSQFASIYLAKSLSLGLPHRGAIAKGHVMLIDLPLNGVMQSNVVGSGVINARKFGISHCWMGCVVNENCFDSLAQDQLNEFLNQPLCTVVEYNTQCSTNPKHNTNFVVNWTFLHMLFKKDVYFFQDLFTKYNKGINDNVATKIKNTHKFYIDVLKK